MNTLTYSIHTSGLALAELTAGALVPDEISDMCMLLAESKLAILRVQLDLRDAAGYS